MSERRPPRPAASTSALPRFDRLAGHLAMGAAGAALMSGCDNPFDAEDAPHSRNRGVLAALRRVEAFDPTASMASVFSTASIRTEVDAEHEKYPLLAAASYGLAHLAHETELAQAPPPPPPPPSPPTSYAVYGGAMRAVGTSSMPTGGWRVHHVPSVRRHRAP